MNFSKEALQKISDLTASLTNYVLKVTGKSLVADTEIAKIHEHTNKATLDLIQEALTTALKNAYDDAVSNSHTHANKTALDNVSGNNTGDQDLSGLKLKPNQVSITSSATPTPTGNYQENEIYITALAEASELQAPSGTPVNGNTLLVRITSDDTPRALTYNAIYRAIEVELPNTTVANKTIYIGAIYNSTATKWDVTAVIQ